MKPTAPPQRQFTLHAQTRMHLRAGWWLILLFLTMGIVLESLHGFKIFWYLDLSNSTRRLMFTLAHSHGTLLGLLNVAFALTLPHLPDTHAPRLRFAGKCLVLASLLLPGGFLLGGLVIHGGDPGLFILLVPVGAVCLLAAVWSMARSLK